MKAFDSLEKDSLILLSILNEDLPALMKALAKTSSEEESDFSFSAAFPEDSPPNTFSQNMVYMHGVAHKMDLDFDGTRKYFRQELKSLITEAQWSALQQFFETFTDKVSMSEEENKKNIIYATTFAYRFLYNLYFLSTNDKTTNEEDNSDNMEDKESEDNNSQNNYAHLMPGFNAQVLKNSTPEKKAKPLTPKEKIETALLDNSENNVLMSSKNISILKSLVAPGQETFVQKSFVEMSEIFYYMPQLKSLGLHFDDFREALTHGITGCFLLEEENEQKSLALTKNLTLEKFFQNVR